MPSSAIPTPQTILLTNATTNLPLTLLPSLVSLSPPSSIAVLSPATPQTGHAIISTVASRYPAVRLIFKTCDISSWASQAQAFKEVFEEFGSLDLVVAGCEEVGGGLEKKTGRRGMVVGETVGLKMPENAGTAGIPEGPGRELLMAGHPATEPVEPPRTAIDENLMGSIYTTWLAAHYMNRKPKTTFSRGKLLALLPPLSSPFYPSPLHPLSAAAAAGTIHFIRSTAPLLAPQNIQLFAIAPGAVPTETARSTIKEAELVETEVAAVLAAVQWVVEAAVEVTGVVLEVEGGEIVRRETRGFSGERAKENVHRLAARA